METGFCVGCSLLPVYCQAITSPMVSAGGLVEAQVNYSRYNWRV